MKQYIDQYHDYYIKELASKIRSEYMDYDDIPEEFIKHLVENKDRFTGYDKLNSYYIVIPETYEYGTYIYIYNSDGKIKLKLFAQYVGYSYGYTTEDMISLLILDGKYGENIFPCTIDYCYDSGDHISESEQLQ